MKLPPHVRRTTVLSAEGQMLAAAGSMGEDLAADNVRCIVDGAMNALIRIEGARAASVFAFGLADRVAGGIREETAVFQSALADAPPVEEEEKPPVYHHAARRKHRRERRAAIGLLALTFAVGVFAGAVWL